MTAALEADQTITYELVNTHHRRAHIRAILLRAKGHWVENKERFGLAGDMAQRSPSVKDI